MLRWALVFLILAVAAAFLGFGGVAAWAAGIAKVLFYVFGAAFIITLVYGLANTRTPPAV
ncbi:MAG: DUF1328 domain-containing protein [Gemmatimonadota bacterium]